MATSKKAPRPPPEVLSSEQCQIFGLDDKTGANVLSLFKELKRLPPMEKDGAMSGRCETQTEQMEIFLKENFGFKNVPGEYIVQGVRSFEVSKPPQKFNKKEVIEFPTKQLNSFKMTVGEIIEWQKSYRVYTSKTLPGMNKEFLRRALQGLSQDGQEAFLMKFVIRISSCPILMEFDGKVIPREIEEEWVHNIKLVSVSGIDFAGRKHDVDDIRTYIQNWKEIFEYNKTSELPIPPNGRDFVCKKNHPKPDLHKSMIKEHLRRMAYIRLSAYNTEKVEVVVETGIGLGVFAGRYLGIDGKIRKWSAVSVKEVLETHGKEFQNIKAVVFALPIFSRSKAVFHDFVEQFEKSYKGPIPVLIADQDMHKLTVAIARQGFIVSELNPADSHGVFGEYWQNLGPAVEEKLALSTVGLLVQHHLINEEVLNIENYKFIENASVENVDPDSNKTETHSIAGGGSQW